MEQRLQMLRKHMMVLDPDRYLPEFVKEPRDIYEERYLLRFLPCTDFVINHISDVLCVAVANKKRFRVYDCLKVLRGIIRNRPPTSGLSADTVEKLFALYKQFIFKVRVDVQWCLSSIMKDHLLSEDAIGWLIEHSGDSVHIVNRLLKYPRPHPKIKEWAKAQYLAGGLADRKSELIGLIIDECVPSFVNEEPSVILWALYKSPISNEQKKRLLKQYASSEVDDAVIEIALRLRYADVIQQLIDEEMQRLAS